MVYSPDFGMDIGGPTRSSGPNAGGGGGGSGGGGGARPPQPDCGGSGSEWVPMPEGQGYPSGGYWKCVGAPTHGYEGRPLGNYNPDLEPFDYVTPPYGGPKTPQYEFPNVPAFDAPEFTAPTFDDALNSPGYQFRLDQGSKALQRSAAARGVLRSGGTLAGILDYGQNAASQEYQNVFNRALDAFDRRYQGARDEFGPRLQDYQNRFAAAQRSGDLGFQRAWDEYIFGINDAFRREQMLFEAGLPD